MDSPTFGADMRRTWIFAFVAVVLAVLAAAMSPLALLAVSRWSGLDWVLLGNIGQAYGAASAVFSALAVAGVGAGLVYQAQQMRTSRIYHIRDVQRELLFRIVEDPQLGGAIGFLDPDRDLAEARERAFILSWLHYQHLTYESEIGSERRLRTEVLPGFFRSEAARRFWAFAREDWRAKSDKYSYSAFSSIVDDEYKKALRGDYVPAARRTEPRRRRAGLVMPVSILAAGVALGWLARRGR
jgi:hypothetical protein